MVAREARARRGGTGKRASKQKASLASRAPSQSYTAVSGDASRSANGIEYRTRGVFDGVQEGADAARAKKQQQSAMRREAAGVVEGCNALV